MKLLKLLTLMTTITVFSITSVNADYKFRHKFAGWDEPEAVQEINITTNSINPVELSTAYSFILSADKTGGEWSWSGDIPTGLSLNSTTGEISGTTTDSGGHSIDITVTKGSVNDTKSFSILVKTGATEIKPADLEGSDFFGRGMSVSNGTILSSSRGSDTEGAEAGAAYLFSVSTGEQIAKIVAEDFGSGESGAGDQFGMMSKISNNYVIIGSPYNDDAGSNAGSAYIYTSNGSPSSKLLPGDLSANNYFGGAVAISDTYALVGTYVNAVYVFNPSNGSQLRKITGLAGSTAYFGTSMQIDGNLAILGDYLRNSSEGAAYIYNISTGTPVAELFADDFGGSEGSSNENFGRQVDISSNYVAIGAGLDNGQGAVYIYDTAGTPLRKIVSNDISSGDEFGTYVSISGNYLAVGATGNGYGAAYVFNITTGSQVLKVTPPVEYTSNIKFGMIVDIDNGLLVVSADAPKNGSAGGAANAGTIFVYDISSGDQITW